MCLCVRRCIHTCVQVPVEVEEGSGYPGAEITDSRELPYGC